jgi:uncharacterized membrane protein
MSGSRGSAKGRQAANAQARQGGGQPSTRRSGQSGAQSKRADQVTATGASGKRGATATASRTGGARNDGAAARNGGAGSRNGGAGSRNGAGTKSGATAARSGPAGAAKSTQLAVPQGWRRFLPFPRSMGWLPFSTFALSVLGLIDAGYQVYTHFSGTGLLGCSAKADSCVLVQSSVYAWIFHIPVAVYGAVFFAFMVVICSPWAWRFEHPRYTKIIGWARLAAVVIGMIFVLYLIYREVVSLDEICEYCTSVHIITFALFALVVYHASAPNRTEPPQLRA